MACTAALLYVAALAGATALYSSEDVHMIASVPWSLVKVAPDHQSAAVAVDTGGCLAYDTARVTRTATGLRIRTCERDAYRRLLFHPSCTAELRRQTVTVRLPRALGPHEVPEGDCEGGGQPERTRAACSTR